MVLGVPVLSVLVMSLNHRARTSYLLHPLAHLWIFSVMIPFLILWAGFALVYRWIPNAPVKPVAAFSGGLVAAFLLEAGRHGLTWYAMNAIGSSRIYGALWVFPVILLWFYLSWLIVLFGAEVAHVVQTGRLELPGREK